MKKSERDQLNTHFKQVEAMNNTLEPIKDFVEQIALSERGAYDDKSERWQESEAGEAANEKIEALEEAHSQLETALEALGEAQTALDNATKQDE